MSAFIPLLEVLPEYQRRGIGSELVRRMLLLLADTYMIDLCCDEELVGFYERFGLADGSGWGSATETLSSSRRGASATVSPTTPRGSPRSL